MNYDAELIDSVIMDIEKYPEFIPWCSGAQILSNNEHFLTAELVAEFKGFSEKYVSKVTRVEQEGSISIQVVAISGPFERLNNIWTIKRLDNGAEVNFSIDFEFKSRILEMVIGMVFSVATEKMIGAFEARVDKLSKIV